MKKTLALMIVLVVSVVANLFAKDVERTAAIQLIPYGILSDSYSQDVFSGGRISFGFEGMKMFCGELAYLYLKRAGGYKDLNDYFENLKTEIEIAGPEISVSFLSSERAFGVGIFSGEWRLSLDYSVGGGRVHDRKTGNVFGAKFFTETNPWKNLSIGAHYYIMHAYLEGVELFDLSHFALLIGFRF